MISSEKEARGREWIEREVHETFKLHTALAKARQASSGVIRPSPRTELAFAAYDQVIEHCVSVALLAQHEVYGSTLALARPCYETLIRGLWLNHGATDAQVQRFIRDDHDTKIGTMINRLQEKQAFKRGTLGQMHEKEWTVLCGYAHSGIVQLSQRLSAEAIGPAYEPQNIVHSLILVGNLALIATQQCLFAADKVMEAKALLDMLAARADQLRVRWKAFGGMPPRASSSKPAAADQRPD